MYSTVKLTKIEVDHSQSMQTTAYKLCFILNDKHGRPPNPDVNARREADDTLSLTLGTLTIELPTNATSEGEMTVKARRMLHDALIRLAEAAKPAV